MRRLLIVLAVTTLTLSAISCSPFGPPPVTSTPTTDVGAIQTEAAQAGIATVTAEAQEEATLAAVKTRAAQSVLASVTAEAAARLTKEAAIQATRAAQATATPTQTSTPANKLQPTATGTPSATPPTTYTTPPTATPRLTDTPQPTATPTPTDTVQPTVTFTPTDMTTPTPTHTPVRQVKCAALTPFWATQFTDDVGVVPLGAYQCDETGYSVIYVLFANASDSSEAERKIKAGLEGEVKAVAGKQVFWSPVEQIAIMKHEDGLYIIAAPSPDVIYAGVVSAALNMRDRYVLPTAAPTVTDTPAPTDTAQPTATLKPARTPTPTEAPAATNTPAPIDTPTSIRQVKCAALTPFWATQFAENVGVVPLGAYQCDETGYSVIYILFANASDSSEAERRIKADLEGEVQAVAGKQVFWSPAEEIAIMKHEDGLYIIAAPSLGVIDASVVKAALDMRETLVAEAMYGTAESTEEPAEEAAKAKALKIGLVTDVGSVNDKPVNQSVWAGVEKAAKEFGLDAKFIESKGITDYEKNIDQFATEGYDVIITVGYLMSYDTAVKAEQYPDIKFGIVDFAYFPAEEGDPDPYEKLSNITSLMFQEDEVGFLAGVLAAGMSESGTICSVVGREIPPIVRFVVGYQTGAKWVNSKIETLNVYIPSYVDFAKGREAAESMIDQGCDVVFGGGGPTGNGGLFAAKENDLMAIGLDVDQYFTYREVKDAVMSSAMKNVDVSVYRYLKAVVGGNDKAGIMMAGIQNDGVGLAPYHDWEDKIPQGVKDKVDEATRGLNAGKLDTGYPPRGEVVGAEVATEVPAAAATEPVELVATPVPPPTKEILYYRVPSGDEFQHYVVDLDTRQEYLLPADGESIRWTVLPGEHQLLLIEGSDPERTASLVDFVEGKKTPLVTSGSVWLYFVSGDRQRIVIVAREERDGESAVYHTSLWDDRGQKLADWGETQIHRGSVRFSPDNQSMAYWREEGDQWQLLIADREGKNPLYLAASRSGLYGFAAFVINGSRMVYTIADGDGSIAYAVDPDGGNRVELCRIEEGSLSLSWSPRSEWVVCNATGPRREDGGPRVKVSLVNALDGEQRAWSEAVSKTSGVFSEDGRKLALAVEPGDEPVRVSMIDLESGEVNVLDTGGLHFSTSLNLAPDATYLVASARDEERETWGLYVLDADGGPPSELISPTEGIDWYMQGFIWPDGEHVLAGCETQDGERSLFVMKRDGSRRVPLGEGVIPASSLSVDGQDLFFSAVRDGKQGIFHTGPDGGNIQLLYPGGDQVVLKPRYTGWRPRRPPPRPKLTPTTTATELPVPEAME